ncbi:MAG: lipopolysaccharide transport periplasmic protein LptA [Rhodospirillaceae bacterium]|nr:lipopolysaccharide transport periplasmic protein LptA [Rhodospirillaceae bacterium]
MHTKGNMRTIYFVLNFFIFSLVLSIPAYADSKLNKNQHDSTLPIEVVADTLEVKQGENKAIFSGNVEVVQGDMILNAAKLVVHYRENSKNPEQPGISLIDASGDVFVTSPRETASGNTGIYNVDKKTIILVGNVVLTQNENVIQGEHLHMNLETGESRVSKGKKQKGKENRVRGLFIPENKEK